MRSFLPFALLGLVGCAGRNGGIEQIVPLSPYGSVEVVGDAAFNGSTVAADFGILPATLDDGGLVMDAAYDVTSVVDGGASIPARRLEIALTGYSGKQGSVYSLSSGTNVVRFHQAAADGSDRLWTSVGGAVVDGGIDAQRRLLKLTNVKIAAVGTSGAVGNATLDGDFHIDFAPGQAPVVSTARARSN